MLDFPNTPNVGDTFTSQGRVWQWDGTKWLPIAASTAFLPLTGGTLTGDVVLPVTSPVTGASAVPKTYVDANYSGYVNKLRNGAFDVWQRGAGPISCPPTVATYTADGWQVNPTGAAVAANKGTAGTAAIVGGAQFIINGAAGVTSLFFLQRIESNVAALLNNQTMTFSAVLSGNISYTPQFSAGHCTTADTFPTGVDVGPVNLQPVAGGAGWTRVAYTFTLPAGTPVNGIQVWFTFPALGAGQSVNIMGADLRATPGLPVGLCANPPPPELRPVHEELAFCQRYFETSYGNGVAPGTVTVLGAAGCYQTGQTSGMQIGMVNVRYAVQKRAVPNIVAYSTVTANASGKVRDLANNMDLNAVYSEGGVAGFDCKATQTVATTYTLMLFNWTVSAEL